MKVCPNCKNKVSNLQSRCPICGTDMEDLRAGANNPVERTDVNDIVKSEYKLTGWNIAFIVLLNVAIVMVALNVFRIVNVDGVWCDWPIIGGVFVACIAYICYSKKISRFVTRLRNTVCCVNFLMLVSMYIRQIVDKGQLNHAWVMEYFIPSTVICFDIIMLVMLIARKLPMFNAFISSLTMSPFTLLILVYALCGAIAQNPASKSMVLVCCALTACVQINLACFYFYKYKDKAEKIFKLWE